MVSSNLAKGMWKRPTDMDVCADICADGELPSVMYGNIVKQLAEHKTSSSGTLSLPAVCEEGMLQVSSQPHIRHCHAHCQSEPQDLTTGRGHTSTAIL